MKEVITVIYKFIRGIFRFLFFVTAGVICKVIFVVFNERGMEKVITIKKAKRIRLLTNFKLKMWKIMPHLLTFFGEKDYLTRLTEKLNYGV